MKVSKEDIVKAFKNKKVVPRYVATHEVIVGDCVEEMRKMRAGSIDAIICDPPYGLGSVKNLPGLLKSWMEGDSGEEHVGGGGFMGNEWDKSVPPPSVWKEALRVLKPGGHMLVFAGTRTQDLMGISIRLAGFELRDEISCFENLNWIYGSGFPKSLNISKQIDKHFGVKREVVGRYIPPDGIMRTSKRSHSVAMGVPNNQEYSTPITAPGTPEAKRFDGFGTALKPAHEPILVFRKELGGTVAENVLKYGTGGINVEGCRIYRDKGDVSGWSKTGSKASKNRSMTGDNYARGKKKDNPGRWPANVIFVHHGLCECVGRKKIKVKSRPASGDKLVNPHASVALKEYGGVESTPCYTDENGMQEIEDWNCTLECPGCGWQWSAPGKEPCPRCHCDRPQWICPVKILDRQSGELTSGTYSPHHQRNVPRLGKGGVYGDDSGTQSPREWGGSKGGASRFFKCFSGDEVRFQYVAKARKAERNKGLENFEKDVTDDGRGKPIDNPYLRGETLRVNIHPTVKPIALMRWLCRLVCPPEGTVLDPFAGSGSTLVAAAKENFCAIGIEQNEEYAKIAKARLDAETRQGRLF